MNAEEINRNDLEESIKKFITIETAQQISRREVRRQLEQEFNLEEDSLSSRKKEINEILQNVLTNLLKEENKKKNEELKKNKKMQESLLKKEEKEEKEEKEDKETSEEQKSTPTQNENNIKKVKEQNGGTDPNESNDDGDEKDTSDSSNERSSKKRKNTSLQHSMSAKKRQYNIMTKEDFLKNAKTIICNISENISLNLEPRVFRTGTCGWHMMDKVYLLVGDQNVLCQFCINCSVIGSKQWE